MIVCFHVVQFSRSCARFTVVNFSPKWTRLLYHTVFSLSSTFSKFFNFFLKPKFQSKLLVFGLLMSFLSSRVSLSRWQLIYNIMPKLFCQHLFWKKSRFFSKKWEIPTFSLIYAGFRGVKKGINRQFIPFFWKKSYYFQFNFDSPLHKDQDSDIPAVQIPWLSDRFRVPYGGGRRHIPYKQSDHH